jgi:hypothetical protein
VGLEFREQVAVGPIVEDRGQVVNVYAVFVDLLLGGEGVFI